MIYLKIDMFAYPAIIAFIPLMSLMNKGMKLLFMRFKGNLPFNIDRNLLEIVKRKESSKYSTGLFTTDNRDKWTDIRQEMCKSSLNAMSLERIESSMFLVSLDRNSPVTREEVGRLLWHGDGHDRFFDKSMQFIVFANGKAGFNGEHSMMEAVPTSKICEFIVEGMSKNSISLEGFSSHSTPKMLAFENLSSAHFESSHKRLMKDIADHEMCTLVYGRYGKGLLKTFGLSPDAFVQMAIQLAYFKMHRICRPTYESSQTRKFAFGRTETTRSTSADSVEWVKAMGNATLKVNSLLTEE